MLKSGFIIKYEGHMKSSWTGCSVRCCYAEGGSDLCQVVVVRIM
jgi:hypothetical protein